MTEIVKINPQEYGIDEQKASELSGNLPQIQLERDVLVKLYNEIIMLDIDDPQTKRYDSRHELKAIHYENFVVKSHRIATVLMKVSVTK